MIKFKTTNISSSSPWPASCKVSRRRHSCIGERQNALPSRSILSPESPSALWAASLQEPKDLLVPILSNTSRIIHAWISPLENMDRLSESTKKRSCEPQSLESVFGYRPQILGPFGPPKKHINFDIFNEKQKPPITYQNKLFLLYACVLFNK